MPKLEMSQEAATVVEWLKAEGEAVEKGEPLLVIETDKVTVEVEAPASGILAGIGAEPNQLVPVTETIAYLLQPGEELPQTRPPVPRPAQATGLRPAARQMAEALGLDLVAVSEVRATPAARRIARERALDLSAVTGSGPRGRVQAADVLAFTPPLPVAAEETAADLVPMSGIRRTIADRMSASHRTTARVTLVTEVDATALVEARERIKASVAEEWGFAPGYNDLLGLIVARALREFSYMNARLSTPDGSIASIERLSTVNLGMAVDTERGLLVPVIRDAGQKDLRTLATEFRALAERARAGKSLPEDLRGGTFTITNLGMYDIDAFTPIINLPEAAILGAGRIQPKPVVRAGEIAIRQMWTLSLAFDHRLVDGAPAARFLQRIKQLVENPYLLLA
jgi:pyruvate dehydrogenase E2 component (dihydrolipoamide acetyltransferase)